MIALTLLKQVITMFLLVGVGYILFRSGKITLENSKMIGVLLIQLALPCVIIKGFLIEKTAEHLYGLLYSAIGAAVLLAVSILISRLFFHRDAIASFAGAFSNPGFFGVPLIIAVLGNGAVFYVACFIAFLNLLQWTYGVALMTRGAANPISLKRVCTAPFVIAIAIGLFFFLSGVAMPTFLFDSISSIAGLNTPLAMLSTGVYLAQTDIAHMFKKRRLYAISAVRLILIPLAAVALLALVPSAYDDMKMALLLAAACPVGANVAIYAQLHQQDYSYAVETVVLSTALSLGTLPFIAWLASVLW